MVREVSNIVRILPVAVLLAGAGISCCSATEGGIVVGDMPPPAFPISGKWIALVFDDGPLPGNTEKVLDALKMTGMRATFSVVGLNVEARPDLTWRIVEEGHELANQTWSHKDLTGLTREEILQEIQKAKDKIYDVTGVRPQYVRPPFGAITPTISEWIEAGGYKVLEPTLDSGDWRDPSPALLRKTILDGVTPGSVILLHDSFPKSVAELPGILEELSKRGFTSIPFSELKSHAIQPK